MGMEQLRARDGSDTRHDLVTGNCLHGPVLDLAQPPQSLLAPHFVPLSLGELFLLRPGEAPRQFSCHSQALLRREVESGFEDLLACHRRYSTFSSRALAARLARVRIRNCRRRRYGRSTRLREDADSGANSLQWWRRRELNPRPEASRERLLHAQPLLGSRPAASRRGKTAVRHPRMVFAAASGGPRHLHPHLASAYGARRVRFPDTVTAR